MGSVREISLHIALQILLMPALSRQLCFEHLAPLPLDVKSLVKLQVDHAIDTVSRITINVIDSIEPING